MARTIASPPAGAGSLTTSALACRGPLRYRFGSLYPFVLSRSAALFAGRRAPAAGSVGEGEGCGQVGHFPGPQPTGCRTAQEAVCWKMEPMCCGSRALTATASMN